MAPSLIAVNGLALAATVVSLSAGAVPAAAQGPPPSINLSPSQFPGVLEGPVGIGPITLSNGTRQGYRVRVFPVLLGQRRDGGVFVREDPAARASAGRYLAAEQRGFTFPPGEAQSVLARLRRVPPARSFYGGVLFQATPGRARGRPQQIRNVLQLTASILLDPTPARRRLSFKAGAIRAESSPPARLRVLVPVTNRGNAYRRVSGRLLVRNSAGRPVARARLRSPRILPGATVDLAAPITERLPAGNYRVSALLRGGRRPLAVRGPLRLFGVNQVATRNARLVDVPSPTAYRGEDVEIKARFRNTGNVPFAPGAQVEVRPVVRGRAGAVALRRPLEATDVKPGQTGEAKVELRLPGSAPVYRLTVQLNSQGRRLDAREVTVTPRSKPAFLKRARQFVTDHALPLLGVLLLVIVVGLVLGLRYLRRLKAAAASPSR